MSELILSSILGSGITTAIFIIIFWVLKNFILQYLTKSISHEFNKKMEIFKSELQERRQDQQHFHELLLKTIMQENKELQSRKIIAADHLWNALLAMKKFSIAVKYLGTLNFNEIEKQSNNPKIQKFLNSVPKCTFAELLEVKTINGQPAEFARPWVTHKAWSLYLAYCMIINYAITQFESAKLGGEFHGLFDEKKLLEIIQNALPDVKIDRIFAPLLSQILDLLELTLITELKVAIESKEDAIAIQRTKKIFELVSDIQIDLKLNTIKSEEKS
jgi:hypothetical protein